MRYVNSIAGLTLRGTHVSQHDLPTGTKKGAANTPKKPPICCFPPLAADRSQILQINRLRIFNKIQPIRPCSRKRPC
jgi:hypothetical protein